MTQEELQVGLDGENSKEGCIRPESPRYIPVRT